MSRQAELRAAGRHRHERIRRHRAGLTPPVGGAPSRTTVLTAALGAAPVTGVGVAGGSAAAAAERHAQIPNAATLADLPPPAAQPQAWQPQASLDPLDAPLPAHVPAGFSAVAVKRKPRTPLPAHVPADFSAVAVKRKPRTPPATAAWVNPNPTAAVTSCFGPRWGRMHEGVDLAAPDGAPILAAGAGTVVRAGPAEGYGNAVLIDHGDGFLTHYGHLSRIAVRVGEHVAAGQQIGDEGSTGHSTGPHLHFEVHQGHYKNPIEPTAWMRQHGVNIPGCGAP